jgi:hypothetical protein
MYAKRLISAAVLTALALALTAEARAGVAVSSLVGGVVNHLEDQDFETVIQNDGNTTIDAGDYLVGMFTISTLSAPPGNTPVNLQAGSTFTGTFLIEVAVPPVPDGATGNSDFTFKPAPSSAWTAAGIDLNPLNGTGTMIVVYEDNLGFPNVTQIGGLSLSAALDTAEDGTLLWEFGFTGAMGAPLASEYWSAYGPNDVATLDNVNILDLVFENGLNVTYYDPLAPILNPHNFRGVATGATQLQTTGTGEGFNPLDPFGNVNSMPAFTESDLYIQPSGIPEPGTMIMWSCFVGLAVGGYSVKRLRRKAA